MKTEKTLLEKYKENLFGTKISFKPFKIKELKTSSLFHDMISLGEDVEIIKIDKKNRFIYKTKGGEIGQLRLIEEDYYKVYRKRDKHYFDEIDKLRSEIDAINERIKTAIAKIKAPTLATLKKQFVTP